MKRIGHIAMVLVALLLGKSSWAATAQPEPTQDSNVPYRLYRTQNMWTLLKLDTRDGRIWQVQFDVQGNNRGSMVLNKKALLDGKQKKKGRFALYPTENMYTFILLDQIDGRVWQVQWSTEEENRGVIMISESTD